MSLSGYLAFHVLLLIVVDVSLSVSTYRGFVSKKLHISYSHSECGRHVFKMLPLGCEHVCCTGTV